MIPWIQKENESASYLSKYSCNIQEYKNIYSNENRLNEVNNIVETEDAYWLYFASNLRGEAKEGLNVINRLQSFPGSTLYE
jgi:glycerate-2-kinase